VPRSVIVAVVVSALVAAGALVASAALRTRASGSATGAPTSEKPSSTSPVGVSGCLVEPCQVLGRATVGGTSIELVADKGGVSGRLRVGGPTSGQVIETTITDMGVKLTADSLQCVSGGPSACLITGSRDGEAEVDGQVVVGRSDSWSALERPFVSDAGYLALSNVDGDSTPEVLAAQHDCQARDPASCSGQLIHVQVFALTGSVMGCSRSYSRLEKLPEYPVVHLTKAQLIPCP